MSEDESFDAIIVGAGIGGLMTAALLAHRKKRVLVLESLDTIGGFQRTVPCEGFTIEPHFHFLQEAGPDRRVRALLASVGIQLPFVELDPIAEFVFPGRRVRIGNDREGFLHHLQQMFPHEAAGLEAMFESMAQLYRCLTVWPASALQQASMGDRPPDPTQLPPELATLLPYASDSLDDYVSRFVHDESLKAVLGGWAAYFGYCGSKLSALPVIVLSEACWDGGIHHPAGGIGALTSALRAAIERDGGGVRLSARVAKILTEDGCAVGVKLANGEELRATHVVSNVDVLTTYAELIDEHQAPDVLARLATLERFRAPFTVYVGVRAAGLDLERHAAVQVSFPNDDVEDQDRAQLEGRFEDIPVSIGIPSLVTPQLAPPGHHLIKIYTFLAPELIGRLRDDVAHRNDCARRMIATAEKSMPGLTAALVMQSTSFDIAPDVYNPHTRGAIGWAPKLSTMLSAPDQVTRIKGFYLCGQWTNTGPATNNVVRSSVRVAELVAAGRRPGTGMESER